MMLIANKHKMKSLYILAILLAYAYFFSSCEKENKGNDDIVTDSIPLKYSDLAPFAFNVDINNDSVNDISLYTHTMCPASHIFVNVTIIKSYNSNVLISYGGQLQSGNYYLLERDSIINDSLLWLTHWIISSSETSYYSEYKPEYIGVKYIKNNQINYGWIHLYNSYFTEFAIDTSNTDNSKNIYAGRKKK